MTQNFNLKTIIKALICLIISGFILSSIGKAEKLISDKIEVNSSIIHLGDIFDVTPILADEKLFQAPPLGRTAILPINSLLKIANKYELNWKNEAQIAQITITRKTKTIDADLIKKIISQHAVNAQHIANATGNTRINLHDEFNTIIIAMNEFGNFNISNFTYRPVSDRFTAKIEYVKNNQRRHLNISGSIENMVRIPVFANNIKRNQVIKTSDIKYIQINHRQIAANVVLTPQEVVGKAAKNNIRAQQPISAHLLKFPDLIKQNTVINLKFNHGRIQLSLKARALTAGAKGALIKVMNLKSGKQIDAIVTGKDQAMTISTNNKTAIKLAVSK